MMTDLCDRPTPAFASAWSSWGSPNPPITSPPILRNDRRETPLSYAVRAALYSEWTRDRSAETVEALLAAGADAREVKLPTGWPVLDTLIEKHLPGR